MARPVRIGLVFEPSAEMLRFVVEQATLLWGGQYQPFFRPGDLGQIERVSQGLGVDVLLALDRTAVPEEAAALDGYQWLGREECGPLAPARDYINNRLLGPERLLDDLPRDSWVLPGWTAGDPLDGLFRVCFGAYGMSDQGVRLGEQFAVRAAQIRIDEGAEVPADAAFWITPVTATGAAIEYRGMSPGAAFVVVDPSDPASLTALWNARACGAQAFPFPAGHEERIANARPLQPLPVPLVAPDQIASLDIRRRNRLGGAGLRRVPDLPDWSGKRWQGGIAQFVDAGTPRDHVGL